VQADADAEQAGAGPHEALIGLRESGEYRVGGTGQTLAVVPGDEGDQLDLAVREAAEQVAVADDVIAVPVVPGVGQEEADVAEQGRRFEVLPGIVAEPVQLRGPVEEVQGEGGDMLAMLAVLVHEFGELPN